MRDSGFQNLWIAHCCDIYLNKYGCYEMLTFFKITPYHFLSVIEKYFNEIRERKTSIYVFVFTVLPGKKQDSGGPAPHCRVHKRDQLRQRRHSM